MTKRIKVLNIVGTRPEAVKMAPIINAMKADDAFECVTCVTAQHREMLDQVLALFGISPDLDLDLMRPGQTLSALTAAIFEKLDPIIADVAPDWILAQGDTTTVMATSLLAYYHKVKFGHVEAGLRTFNNYEPFPEEVNRRVAGVVATAHFAPTERSKQNLLQEKISSENIFVTGNTVIDAVQTVANTFTPSEIGELLESIGQKKIILVTAHRRENFGQPIKNICTAIRTIADQYNTDVHFIYPVHLNPNINDVVRAELSDFSNITLLPPLDYQPLVHLIKNTFIVLTDSGGLQEEAPSFGKPVLVLRNVTERPEGIDAGTVKLVGTSADNIISNVSKLLTDPVAYQKMAKAINPYGDGQATQRILKAIKQLS